MKTILLFFSFFVLSLAARADDNSQTQAGWFSPDCSTCSKLLTPGTANLGNAKGVFRPGKKNHKKPAPGATTETAPVQTGN